MLATSIANSSSDVDSSNFQPQPSVSEWDLLVWLLLRKPFSLREVASDVEVGAARTSSHTCIACAAVYT